MVRTVAPTKPRTAGALGKPLTPSPALAAVVGSEPLARTAVVSKLWDHIGPWRRSAPNPQTGAVAAWRAG